MILFTILLLIIISSVYPTTLYILINHSGGGQALWIGGIGLGSVLVLDVIFFIIPQLGIHGILVNGKEQLIANLSLEYSKRDAVILEKLNIVKQQGCSDELLRDIEVHIKANAYLVERVQFVQTRVRDWAFDLGSIVSVLSTSLVPIVTFIIQVFQEMSISNPTP